jgi:hypothetical protein
MLGDGVMSLGAHQLILLPPALRRHLLAIAWMDLAVCRADMASAPLYCYQDGILSARADRLVGFSGMSGRWQKESYAQSVFSTACEDYMQTE